MSDTYYTISGQAQAKVTEKMSKFLAFAYHVEDVSAVRAAIADISRRFRDARHVCWGYMLGCDRVNFMSNDDGEPSGTAGKPILGQINSFGLTDVVIIVVRYFGGIKLGTSGLTATYRLAAHDCLVSADIVERYVMKSIAVSFPYMAMNGVMKLAKQPGVHTLQQSFDNTCTILLSIRASQAAMLADKLNGLDGVVADIKE